MTSLRLLSATCLLLCLAGAAQAQGIQRIVGPDGRVTYTDRVTATVPSAPAPGTAAPTSTAAASEASTLPYTLRLAVQRYPVTLYTGDKCNPCASARDLLHKRGVPFVEKTVTTPDDAQAFAALGVDNVLPLVTLGAQRVSGLQTNDLHRYLDAAGYPATSQLPRTHRNPAPQPLAAPAAPAPVTPQAGTLAPITAPAAPVTPAPASNNPAGIRF